MDISILIPTATEARGFISTLKMRPEGASGFVHEAPGGRVVLHLCGMGVDNARAHAEAALNRGTGYLVLAGFCGGLQAGPRVGDLIIDTQFPDPTFTNAVAQIATERNLVFHLGRIYTSPRLLGKPEEKVRAGIQAAAVAVDMEGDGVRDLCRARSLPFRSFRTVSDDVRQRLPRALRHVTLDGKKPLRFWCVLAGLVWEWPSVLRILLAARRAEKNLSVVLADWVRREIGDCRG